jgi:PTS system nitrogen regulatory IIA component
MQDEDFDLQQLAEYLHLDAAQLARLAEREQLPGRKVGGQWRFSRGEINLWLERRIGVSDTDELARVENALERAGRHEAQGPPQIYELLPLAAIEVPLAARTRSSVITSMVNVAARTGWLWDVERMTDAVLSREELYPTALDSGVALLHPRRPLAHSLERPFIAFGRTDHGIPFGHPHGVLTDLFFLLCSASERGHLHTLARLSRLLSDEEVLAGLRTASRPGEIHELLADREQALLD